MSDLAADVIAKIRDVPDFPKPGILFKDITPVLADPELFGRVVRGMGEGWGEIDVIVGMEARGFLFGAAMMPVCNAGFAPARKQGKLPYETVAAEYDLEYGTATLELHTDAVGPGQRVLVVDDLLATGGTAVATVDLIRRLGATVVGCSFLIELGFLDGRAKLDCPVRSIITY